ncbi:uncharacterized protein LOC111372478 [Olea europaea var. sylvestris]|uniref:uncharacterized protein LOC111372478 n=1 Tax=Olea europaea var. sylvestris TaxID=158386 RepID=UPI000C1D120D|nr:uncharacterized protein LOC111372478 [Olea europaea var. sylvestris]
MSCEILDENKYLHLHSVIAKHNMHGPCGNLNPKNVCLLASSDCKNKYPKDYCNSTIFGDNSYPLYRRRHNGISIKVRGQMLDNRWVVPYNPYLSAKFDCYINIEVCSSIKAVMYFYKYVYKRHDHHQHVTYNNKDDLSIIIGNEYMRRTMLIEFFRMNKANEFARTLLYRDFPTHFVWNANGKVWTAGKQHIVIGRIVTVNPSEGERYFLRVLLNHIRGPTLFDSFKTLNGVTVNIYQEAALLHDLLKGDNHCEEYLSEAIIYKIPNSLRRLFATLLTLCSPNHPKLLWDKYKAYMIDDYVHRNISVEDDEVQAMEDINSILESLGKNVNDYGIVSFFVNIDETQILTRMVAEETINFNIERGFNYVEGNSEDFFLYKALIISVRSQNFIALATASFGVAASLLPGSRTAHSRFEIPLETVGEVNCSVSKQSALGMLLKMSRLIIWDEAPMVNRCVIEAVNRMIKDITDYNLPFGGKVIVFGEDFRQVLPVVPKGKKEDVMKASSVFSDLWPSYLHLPLVENMRAKLDPMFCTYLLRIGDGTKEENTCKCVILPNSIILSFEDEITSLKILIHHVFPNIQTYADNLHDMVNRVILTPTNECVDYINRILLEQIPSEIFTCYSFDETIDNQNKACKKIY